MATKKQTKAVAKKGSTAVALGVNFGQDAGAGVSGLSEDRVIPILSLLATNSPQVQKGQQNYVAGAEAGMAINKGTKRVYELREGDGLVIVPVDRQKWFVEYRNRDAGGGFRNRHEPDSPFILGLTGGRKVFGKIPHPEIPENEIVETIYVPALVLDGPGGNIIDTVVIPFKSKQLGPWSEWATLVASTLVQVGNDDDGNPIETTLDKAAPMWAHQLRLRSTFSTSAKGDFWNYVIEPAVADKAGVPNVIESLNTDTASPTYVAAKELNTQFAKGQREIGEDGNDDNEAPAGGGSVFEKQD